MTAVCVAVTFVVGSPRSERPAAPRGGAPALSGGLGAAPQRASAADDARGSVATLPAVTPIRSRPVRELAAARSSHRSAARARPIEAERKANLFHSTRRVDRALVPASRRVVPPPLLSFDGISNASSQAFPPDTDGDVGPSHYMQIVNTSFGIWNKLGQQLLAPTDESLLWSNAPRGNLCRVHDLETDGVVLYDQLAGRWLFSYLALNLDFDGEPVPPYFECVAVSSGGDPLGSWCAYSFRMDGITHAGLPDYPKFGVWPDSYFMSVNNFLRNGNVTDVGVAFDRGRMLRCRPARVRSFTVRNPLVMLPADNDGPVRPPRRSPGYFVVLEPTGTALRLYRFQPNWPGRAPARAPGPIRLAIAPAGRVCAGSQCILQPGTPIRLDGLDDGRLMYRLVYRNFGDHEALLLNHTNGVGSLHAGVRWYEIRNPRIRSVLYQQGTYAPDVNSRWIGSVAFDKVGDIAALYNVSGPTAYPSLRYTARAPTDPLGTLGAGEGVLAAGAGSIVSGYGPGSQATRWGDYASLTVDPVDDCTFWFTGEYLAHPGDFKNWQTRIGAFRLPTCH